MKLPTSTYDPPPRTCRGARVLVVDDDAEMRHVLKRALEVVGMEVRTESDGISALKVTLAERPDALVLDLALPRLHGFKVLRAIRANPRTAATPVVVLTGLLDPACSLWSAADALRADAFLAKPIPMGDFRETVARVMAGSAPDQYTQGLFVARGRSQIDVARQSLHFGGTEYRFSSPKCLLLLAFLLDNPEGASKHTLLREVWPRGENCGVVGVTIGRLRKELAEAGIPLVIEHCGEGYRARTITSDNTV